MKIAFLDSGIGGLTVLEEAIKVLPNEEYIYFADSKNAPYGTKSSKKINTLVFDAVRFLAKQDLKALVLACNTATSVSVKKLRKEFSFPIIGMEPAVKPAIEQSDKKVLICATPKTLKEKKLQKLIKRLNGKEKVERLSLQELVVIAEKFQFKKKKVNRYLKKQFEKVDWTKIDTIVLGCTHFPFFKEEIQNLIPKNIRILDGNVGTVNYLKTQIIPNPTTHPLSIRYFISKKPKERAYFDRYFDYLKAQSTEY